MTLEVLSEEEIKCIEERAIRNEHEAFYVTPRESAKIANTIKLQRQQLAEQERKVAAFTEALEDVSKLKGIGRIEGIQECIYALGDNLNYSWGCNPFAHGTETLMHDFFDSLLKPESEASGD